MSVWVMPSVDVYENFLKRSQAVAGGGHPHVVCSHPHVRRKYMHCKHKTQTM